MKFTKDELHAIRKLTDSIKDGVETYTIRWQDLNAKRKGWTDDINHVDTFKASSYHEALEKLMKTMSLGIGTANMLIVGMKSDSSSYAQSGTLDKMLKTVKDSKVKDNEQFACPHCGKPIRVYGKHFEKDSKVK